MAKRKKELKIWPFGPLWGVFDSGGMRAGQFKPLRIRKK